MMFVRNLSQVTETRSAFKILLVIHEGTGRLQLTPMHRWKYCNGFDQLVARQKLDKYLPLVLHYNNGESIVVANVTARS
jgi:hypothetical protein